MTISSSACCCLLCPKKKKREKKGQPLLPEPPSPALLLADLCIPPCTCSKEERPQLERGQGVTFLCSGAGFGAHPGQNVGAKPWSWAAPCQAQRERGDRSCQHPQLPPAAAEPEDSLLRAEDFKEQINPCRAWWHRAQGSLLCALPGARSPAAFPGLWNRCQSSWAAQILQSSWFCSPRTSRDPLQLHPWECETQNDQGSSCSPRSTRDAPPVPSLGICSPRMTRDPAPAPSPGMCSPRGQEGHPEHGQRLGQSCWNLPRGFSCPE